jgi:hypothetical protein
MAKDTAGELFYVNVKDAVTVRKTMLETAKSTINCLQRLSKFQVIRDEKEAKLQRVNELVHELEEMSIKFKSYMPDVKDKHLNSVGIEKGQDNQPKEDLKEEAIKEVKSKSKKSKKKGKDNKDVKKDSKEKDEKDEEDLNDITKLESAISNIENKLNNMLKD